MSNSVKSLRYIKGQSVAPDLSKALTTVSDATLRISAVDRKNLELEKYHISWGDQQAC